MCIQTSPYPFWFKVGLALTLNSAQIFEIGAMADKPAQARKRQASASLRTLANELQIDARRRNYDMSRVEFSSLLEKRSREALPTRYRRVTVPPH